MIEQHQQQLQEGQLASVSHLQAIVESVLPQDEIVYCFAYGSGVLSQQLLLVVDGDGGNGDVDTTKEGKQTDAQNMLDLIVVVRDAHRFHRANLDMNPDHYSAVVTLLSGGDAASAASSATWWQRHRVNNMFLRNPGVYFNICTGAESGSKSRHPPMKYGVVQAEDLYRDLTNWKYLYLAGRMQKPVVTIMDRQQQDDDDGNDATVRFRQENHNLPGALSAALLLLQLEHKDRKYDTDEIVHPISSSTSTAITASSAEVFMQIASLSYTGDLRMAASAFEDPHKVRKLVEGPGQLERFQRLYTKAASRLQEEGILSVDEEQQTWTWDAQATEPLWRRLPETLQYYYTYYYNFQERKGPSAADKRNMSLTALQEAMPRIVAPAARYQSLKGLATVGAGKSWSYLARKLSKGALLRR